jgi:4-alpha-glucanotransferase
MPRLPDSVRNWGIQPTYRDWKRTTRRASDRAVAAVLDALGARTAAPPRSPVVAVFQDDPRPLRGDLRLEDGGRRTLRGELPVSLPAGYHRLNGRLLVVAPARCPAAPRAWGWAVQLYSALSRESAGIGDLGDLRRLARWSARLGAEVLLLNPLHAVAPVEPQQPSPYYPSTRLYRNPLYLRVDGVAPERPAVIDRDRVLGAKLPALELEFASFGGHRRFAEYQAAQGAQLQRFGEFCARLDGRAPAFHAWLQWRIDEQLAAAAEEIGLIHDLAIGVDPDGFDASLWRDVFAGGVRIGAPPDEFNGAGQDWGLPPLDPWKLRAAEYAPFIATLRAGFRHGRGLRIDHVMGLFRLWWIPPGAGPKDGAYVRYPWRDLLAILALEASRAGAFVVGEDLGTVEPWVRRELRRRGVLSYRVLWFENRPPPRYPAEAMAAITTHDLPTTAGLWTGRDVELQREAGLEPNSEGTAEIRERLRRLTGVEDAAAPDEVTLRTYERLATAPSQLLTATLEDAAGALERPNLPGTVDERPNWRLPLPLSLEELERSALARDIASALGR